MSDRRVIFVTPKAFAQNKDELEKGFPDASIEPTPLIYMNMLSGWSEQDCDDVIYIYDEETLKTDIKFR